MFANRSSHASVSMNGVVWITGGYRSRNSTEFVYGNGSVIKGPDLPIDKWGHCMVDLEDGRAIILGGDQNENDVLIYRSSDNSFESGPPLLFGRRFPACTLFRSPLHEGRQVVLVVGGKSDGEVSAEVLDFTNTSSKWMQSKWLIYQYVFDFDVFLLMFFDIYTIGINEDYMIFFRVGR